MKVTVILKGHTDKLGRQSLYTRIYTRTNGKDERKFKKQNIKLHPDQWDAKGMLVKSTHPDHKRLNLLIRNMIFKKEADLLSGKAEYQNADLFTYIKDCLNEWDKIKEESTLRQHRGELGKLKGFTGPVMISEINPTWLRKYQSYCVSLGNKPNTVWKTFKFIRTIIKKAFKERVIEQDPFNLFQMPAYRDPKKIFLSAEQIEKIEGVALKDNIPAEYEIAAIWFALACYTGLRFSDLAAFDRKAHIKQGRLIVHTQKTFEVVSMPLNDKLTALFDRVNWQPLPYTNEHYNRLLKAVGALADIEETLTSHVARHTFATLALTKGIPLEVTQKLLGHRSIRTTAIYAKIIDQVSDKHYIKLFDKDHLKPLNVLPPLLFLQTL